jgi:Cdc6-like AAA superfamily ATPase
MKTEQKEEIRALTEDFVKRYASQKEAVRHLDGVSEASLINVRKGHWEGMSDELWLTLGRQVGYMARRGWEVAETDAHRKLLSLMQDARSNANVYAIIGQAGAGKSTAAKEMARSGAYHIVCAEYHNRKTFLATILTALGRENMGLGVAEMIDKIVELFRRQASPLLILDEADKLNDQVFYFFITLYNKLEGHCGIVLLSTPYLQKRIEQGRKLGKKGYEEIYSRIGRKFPKLKPATQREVKRICELNGLSDGEVISRIHHEAEGDLRRVERAVHKYLNPLTVQSYESID